MTHMEKGEQKGGRKVYVLDKHFTNLQYKPDGLTSFLQVNKLN